MVGDQHHEFTLDVEPELAVEGFQRKALAQILDGVFDADVVKLDAFARRFALGVPVRVFEAFARTAGDLAENGEVAIEPVEYGFSDLR